MCLSLLTQQRNTLLLSCPSLPVIGVILPPGPACHIKEEEDHIQRNPYLGHLPGTSPTDLDLEVTPKCPLL